MKTKKTTAPGKAKIPSAPSLRSPKETVLLVITGITPGVLTETVWALAQENPPVIPDRVVTISTATGARVLQTELLTASDGAPSIWQQLRTAILGKKASAARALLIEEQPRIITSPDLQSGTTRPLEDIRTPFENEAAADFILEEVRKLTANDDCTVIASMAGGRKTMGALLYAAMTLLGRHGDRLTHVLISEPYDSFALQPKFYFPLQANGLHTLSIQGQAPRKLKSKDARIELAEVPFPRLRYLFADQIGRFPGRFTELVKTATTIVTEFSRPVELFVDVKNAVVECDGVKLKLSGREFTLFQFLVERAQAGKTPFAGQLEAVDDYKVFLKEWCTKNEHRSRDSLKGLAQRCEPDDIKRCVNSLRDCLKENGIGQLVPVLFPVRGVLGFPPARVIVRQQSDVNK